MTLPDGENTARSIVSPPACAIKARVLPCQPVGWDGRDLAVGELPLQRHHLAQQWRAVRLGQVVLDPRPLSGPPGGLEPVAGFGDPVRWSRRATAWHRRHGPVHYNSTWTLALRLTSSLRYTARSGSGRRRRRGRSCRRCSGPRAPHPQWHQPGVLCGAWRGRGGRGGENSAPRDVERRSRLRP